VSANEVIAIHFRLIYLGEILAAVGVFMRVGGPSVSTVSDFEYRPKPIVFPARTRKLTLMLGVKVSPPGGTNVKDVTRPSTVKLLFSTQVAFPWSQSN
jgi:hypothetical protein